MPSLFARFFAPGAFLPMVLTGAAFLFVLLAACRLIGKRLDDLGDSCWKLLLAFIPVVHLYLLYRLVFVPFQRQAIPYLLLLVAVLGAWIWALQPLIYRHDLNTYCEMVLHETQDGASISAVEKQALRRGLEQEFLTSTVRHLSLDADFAEGDRYEWLLNQAHALDEEWQCPALKSFYARED